MENIKILTDSSVQLTDEEIKKYNIEIIPLTIQLEGEILGYSNMIDPMGYLTIMEKSDVLPTTSQPSVGAFQEKFEEMSQDGSDILFIGLSEQLSGTVNAARIASEMVDANITVVDSETLDRGLGIQVIGAAQFLEQGKNLSEIIDGLIELRPKIDTYVYIDQLDNLVKGGRVSTLSGKISHLLKIKVILEVKDGKLEVANKGRGKKFLRHFEEEMLKTIADHQIKFVSISHSDAPEIIEDFKNQIKEQDEEVAVTDNIVGPVISTHTGRGAFSVTFVRNQ